MLKCENLLKCTSDDVVNGCDTCEIEHAFLLNEKTVFMECRETGIQDCLIVDYSDKCIMCK